MPLSSKEMGMCAVFGFGVAIAIYYATQSTSGDANRPIPSTQGEAQVMGLGVQAGMRVNAGTPLDCRPEVHFWSPGLDPDGGKTTTIVTPHRYPAIPGGNISTVMHKGWSAMNDSAPADGDWARNPPEIAVLLCLKCNRKHNPKHRMYLLANWVRCLCGRGWVLR